jgi:hypothetical protein
VSTTPIQEEPESTIGRKPAELVEDERRRRAAERPEGELSKDAPGPEGPERGDGRESGGEGHVRGVDG